MRSHVAIATLAALAFAGQAQGAAPKVALFDFELYDTSQEGEAGGVRQDQTGRLADITRQARDLLGKQNVAFVDVAPAKKELDGYSSLRTCGACVATAAAGLGADYSVMGYVQKVSNLILNINVEIRDARTGEVVRKGSTDIRGNTDESWSRGISYLMRNQIMKHPLTEGRPQ